MNYMYFRRFETTQISPLCGSDFQSQTFPAHLEDLYPTTLHFLYNFQFNNQESWYVETSSTIMYLFVCIDIGTNSLTVVPTETLEKLSKSLVKLNMAKVDIL